MHQYPQVISIGDILISTALLTERFACDLHHCKGICCVEGESGAPLLAEDLAQMEREYEAFAPYMTEQGRQEVACQGLAVVDIDGDMVTPLVKQAECVYARFDGQGCCSCAIEQAYFDKKTQFRKPISCWLYPIRVQELAIGCALNYHQWHVCAGACVRGAKEQVPVYVFLKEPIIAKFGAAFYQELDIAASLLFAFE